MSWPEVTLRIVEMLCGTAVLFAALGALTGRRK
jgi:hypothetical protein